jgi:hypothetical protein
VARLAGIVVGLLVACLVLPIVATYAHAAIPLLVGMLVLLGIWRLAFPVRRRR